ncbi:MAG: ATP-binding protein, partial [Acidobacteriota bacterium]
MGKIKILPENIANRIAAGEVVEHPASIVKELMENSIDAAASEIRIFVEEGGKRLIRVVDNGEGMDSDDVLLCFERHSTSKINTLRDLNAVQ